MFKNNVVGSEEVATTQFGSGGGFSSIWDRTNASWQEEAVKAYLTTRSHHLPDPSTYAAKGRATPDVSALGEGYQVLINGKVQTIGGTSASAPVFASLVSLLNEARLQAGKPPMGAINAFLYSHPEAFTDVVNGTNAIDRDGAPFPSGWGCAKGWDPVTGLGTPKFDKLLAAAMAL